MNAINKFYKVASAGELGDGFGVFLDGRRLMTPAKAPLIVPSLQLAQEIAKEWDAQGAQINTATMPISRLINVAIDRAPLTREALCEEIKKYSSSDLLCYRTLTPEILYKRQCELWDVEIAWIKEKFGLEFIYKNDSLGLFQSENTLQKVYDLANNYDNIRLTTLAFVTALAGSAILGFALVEKHLNADEIFQKIRIEEDYNATIWGYDDEDLQKAQGKMDDLKAAFTVIAAI